MTARRAGWPMVGPAVLIDAVTAPAMMSLLADGRKRALREHWRLSDETLAIISSLDALADRARKMAPPAHADRRSERYDSRRNAPRVSIRPKSRTS